MQVLRRRSPGGGIGVDLFAGADVLDLVLAVIVLVNQTNGMPRRSANLICLPNFSALAATSAAIPRLRSAAATSCAAHQLSSLVSVTSTAVGTERVAVASSWPRIRETSRVTPMESPTPGNLRLPLLARAS